MKIKKRFWIILLLTSLAHAVTAEGLVLYELVLIDFMFVVIDMSANCLLLSKLVMHNQPVQ